MDGKLIGAIIIFRFNSVGWCLGKITKYMPNSTKFNYEVFYEEDDEKRDHKLSTDKYVGNRTDFDKFDAGTWVLVAAKAV